LSWTKNLLIFYAPLENIQPFCSDVLFLRCQHEPCVHEFCAQRRAPALFSLLLVRKFGSPLRVVALVTDHQAIEGGRDRDPERTGLVVQACEYSRACLGSSETRRQAAPCRHSGLVSFSPLADPDSSESSEDESDANSPLQFSLQVQTLCKAKNFAKALSVAEKLVVVLTNKQTRCHGANGSRRVKAVKSLALFIRIFTLSISHLWCSNYSAGSASWQTVACPILFFCRVRLQVL